MPTKQVFGLVLSSLDDGQEYGAFQLFEVLKSKGISESDIKEALAYLINDHQIILTSDRRLRSPQAAAHV